MGLEDENEKMGAKRKDAKNASFLSSTDEWEGLQIGLQENTDRMNELKAEIQEKTQRAARAVSQDIDNS